MYKKNYQFCIFKLHPNKSWFTSMRIESTGEILLLGSKEEIISAPNYA